MTVVKKEKASSDVGRKKSTIEATESKENNSASMACQMQRAYTCRVCSSYLKLLEINYVKKKCSEAK